jgi:hypothetical protein
MRISLRIHLRYLLWIFMQFIHSVILEDILKGIRVDIQFDFILSWWLRFQAPSPGSSVVAPTPVPLVRQSLRLVLSAQLAQNLWHAGG